MPPTVGTRLGRYEILAPIGAGGMGEVYRARDTKLKRDVALKVLTEAFARDPGRMARFEREAEVLASLNHPHIAQIYGVEEQALVMELVEGESPRGPMPFDDAWKIALQIADALEYAHERGVIHRDLKPSNVKVTSEGVVKLLDFGLAKAFSDQADGSGSDPENSPTITLGATVAGVVMGTAAYMAPEQAKGKRVDKRADIWSWGVVLYELLTGERLFQGEDTADTLAQVLAKEPDLERVPAKVRHLVGQCLQKDPKQRLRDIGDAKRLLEEERPAVEPAPSRSRRSVVASGVAVVAMAALAALAFVHFREAPLPVEPARFEIFAPPKNRYTNFLSISPDGRKIAFTAMGENGQVQLWIRSLDALAAKPLTRTSTFPVPFWSPDSRYIAYQLDGKLRKIEVTGGQPQTLCDTSGQFQGGAWSKDGVIVFGGPEGLKRVLSPGGVPAVLTKVDASRQEIAHSSPVFLPDGRHFLYLRRSSVAENSGIYAGSLDDTPEKQSSRRLLATELNTLYAPPSGDNAGRLLFLRENTLMAQPFDARKLELAGEPVLVADSVGRVPGLAAAYAALSANGVLVYRANGFPYTQQLTWFDRSGKALGTVGEPGPYTDVALSPDGKRAATARFDQSSSLNLWMIELGKNLPTRFTFDKAGDRFPVWSPDGNRIAFGSAREGKLDLYWKISNGATTEEILLKSSPDKFPLDWSRDGRYLLYSVIDPKTGADLWYLPMAEGERKPVRFLATQFSENQGRFSPDGRFVAYMSNESGPANVYVRSFPDPTGKWQVSKGGGTEPRWRGDGKELFYISGNRVMAVDISASPAFQRGAPKVLFETRGIFGYDVSASGKQFLMSVPAEDSGGDSITVVLNWWAGLKK